MDLSQFAVALDLNRHTAGAGALVDGFVEPV